ncbi:hypothetical protein HPB52_010750 [Rhipicephalus sanguineus]|uniref:Uncharacterized protein n=1 Tax=Rhipicephalus sanguineus TaxID=34632 RepID=A0A9D4PJ00_RHISA|nr:hypothetical protein HPB52_010750 [Rhipicephalus sanguineus]
MTRFISANAIRTEAAHKEKCQLRPTASEDEYSDHSRSDSSGGQSQEEGDSFEDFEEEELLASDFSELHEATPPGSPATKAAAVIMIMAFVITHGLTWVALDDLLQLIDVWPIEFLVNELPPDARTKNCMLGGLWCGSHPDMSLFMAKFVDELNQCGGIMRKHATTVVRSAIHAICCCVDAPARAAVGSIQFNGLFGCPWCYTCAEHHEVVLFDLPSRTHRGLAEKLSGIRISLWLRGILGLPADYPRRVESPPLLMG